MLHPEGASSLYNVPGTTRLGKAVRALQRHSECGVAVLYCVEGDTRSRDPGPGLTEPDTVTDVRDIPVWGLGGGTRVTIRSAGSLHSWLPFTSYTPVPYGPVLLDAS
ncbi:hypothetical protein NDU88_011124 [Pleurodeles waltl]|uniref:Uncharacterized protein n=1 Tax=Pleurodeles waltl TaxID=8319 RepID=A0AAV7R2H2_PLEWA|nr:hypothetical protein NDU88_011124 [Pleurodeles waltl]